MDHFGGTLKAEFEMTQIGSAAWDFVTSCAGHAWSLLRQLCAMTHHHDSSSYPVFATF